MKTKTVKQPKQAKPAVQLKDIGPKKDAKGGTQRSRVTSLTVTFGGSL